MEVIFTGRKRDTTALRHILRDDDIDAVVMTAPNHPSAVVSVPPDKADDARPAIARAIQRMERERDADDDDDGVDDDTPKRAPEALYWRAFAAMRTAHARIEPFEQSESVFAPDDVEWAAAIGLADVNAVIQAVEDAHGTCRIALEEANEKAAALLTGMRAIALVLRNPLADNRREISNEDREKRFNATAAIGYLLVLLRELAADGAAERWMSQDERGWLDRRCHGATERGGMILNPWAAAPPIVIGGGAVPRNSFPAGIAAGVGTTINGAGPYSYISS